jgi:hypothetical protein
MSWRVGTAWKVSAVVFTVAVAFNSPWEVLQSPLYRIVQMLILPPAIFAVAARLAPRQHRRKEE